MNATVGSGATQSVRLYFAKLALHGKPRAALSRWSTLPVETFFVAMRLPRSAINNERRPCGSEPQPLSTLFASIRWE